MPKDKHRRASVLFDLEQPQEHAVVQRTTVDLPPVTVRQYVKLALRLVAAGETPQALRLMEEAFAMQLSGRSEFLLSNAECAHWLLCSANWNCYNGITAQAVLYAEKAVEIHPTVLTLGGLAWIYMLYAQQCEDPQQRIALEGHSLGKFSEALSILRDKSEESLLLPLASVVRLRLRASLAHALCDQIGDAVELVEELLNSFTLEPLEYVLLATLHTTSGNYERAHEVLRVLRDMYPNHLLGSIVGASVAHALRSPIQEVRAMIAGTIKRMNLSSSDLVSAFAPPVAAQEDALAREAATVLLQECGCGDSSRLTETLYHCTCVLMNAAVQIGDAMITDIVLEWATSLATQDAAAHQWSRQLFGRILETEARALQKEGTASSLACARDKLQVALQSSRSSQCLFQLAQLALPQHFCSATEGTCEASVTPTDIAVAESYLQSALKLDPRNTEAQHLLGKCRLAIGELAGATEILLSAASNALHRPIVPFEFLVPFFS